MTSENVSEPKSVDLAEAMSAKAVDDQLIDELVLKHQAPRPALAQRIRTLTPQRGDQLAELTRAQPGKQTYPGRLRRRDHTSHDEIISVAVGLSRD